jgi:polyphosphate kinase 2 (PPK2 family)
VCGKGTRSISKSGPTKVDPVYKSKEQYQELLREHVAQLSSQQEFFYANRYAVLLIFQATNAAGRGGAISHVISGGNSVVGLVSGRCLSLKVRPFV